ncbi:MAG: hypothetical protein AAFW65_00185 [Pseudomonadota bacterium]
MKRIFVIASLIASPAFADVAAYNTAFEQGRYVQAAEIAVQDETSDTLALAARALLADGMSGEDQPAAALLGQAETYARRALELDPAHIEGQLQLAIALSLKMRPMSTREARRTGYSGVPRTLAESVLSADPENAYAHGLLAVWNVEVVRRGGPIGSAIMGASVREAREHYKIAVTSRPGDASIHWQYARALAALDPRKYRPDIDAALAAARASPLDDALETTMAARCDRLQAALDTLSSDAVEALAGNML